MFVAAVIVERFSNTHHCHLETVPPRRGEWGCFLDLKYEVERHYGTQVSFYYRDIGSAKAVPVGWVFQCNDGEAVIETWVSVVDAATLKYIDIRHLAALIPADPPHPSILHPASSGTWD